MAKSDLARIPGDKDFAAERILRRAPKEIDRNFTGSLSGGDILALGRYGVRMVTVALRRKSIPVLERALLATAIGAFSKDDDFRDLLIRISLHHAIAKLLNGSPTTIFEAVASRFPESATKELLRNFGLRDDVTLESFGWKLVETPEGPDICPT